MFINKIITFPLANNTNSKNSAPQNHPLKPLGADTFVKFTSTPKVASSEEIYRVIDALRGDPKHPERRNLFNEQLLYEIAMLDVLTGLKNRRALYVDLEDDIETAKKQNTGISVAMFDMDYFKSINDLFDHDKGDEFLKTIGDEISRAAEQNDCKAYRYGGEEFVVTMPGASLEAAVKIAKEVSSNINQNPKLQGYYDSYIENAQKKIAKLEAIQEPFVDFKRYLTEYEIREKDFSDYKQRADAVSATKIFLATQLTDSMKAMKGKFQRLVEHALINATSENDQRYLNNKIVSLQKSGEVKIEYDDDLKNYLNTRFNKEFEIAQIGTWVNHVQKLVDGKPQGFTITAGVKEFKDLDTNAKDPVKHFVEQADALLIKGKNEGRGQVYSA